MSQLYSLCMLLSVFILFKTYSAKNLETLEVFERL